MRHLIYGTNFLHLFAFLVRQPPQSALLHCQTPTLLLYRWLACLTGSSILVLKLTFSADPFPRNLPLSLSNGLISRFLSRRCTEVSGVENIRQCGRRAFGRTSLYFSYLLTYLLISRSSKFFYFGSATARRSTFCGKLLLLFTFRNP